MIPLLDERLTCKGNEGRSEVRGSDARRLDGRSRRQRWWFERRREREEGVDRPRRSNVGDWKEAWRRGEERGSFGKSRRWDRGEGQRRRNRFVGGQRKVARVVRIWKAEGVRDAGEIREEIENLLLQTCERRS